MALDFEKMVQRIGTPNPILQEALFERRVERPVNVLALQFQHVIIYHVCLGVVHEERHHTPVNRLVVELFTCIVVQQGMELVTLWMTTLLDQRQIIQLA